MGDRCPRRAQCEAAKQAAYANNNGGNGDNRRHNNNGGNNRRHNGNNSGNNRRMPQTPPPYYGPQGGTNVTVNNITVNYNYASPAQQQPTEDKTVLGWLQGKIAGMLGGRSAAEAMFRGQLPPNANA
jgi:hypothetical protein